MAFWRNRWVPRAGLVLLALGLVGSLAGLGSTQSKNGKLEDDLTAAQRQISDMLSNREQLLTMLDGKEGQLSQLRSDLADAHARADNAVSQARRHVKAQLRDQFNQLKAERAALAGKEKDLERREREVGIRENFISKNSFGDGLFKVGQDIASGTYDTSGAGDCYWAELRSSDTNDIITNNISSGPQTVRISSAWFESNGCGTWRPA
jgi:hypothetical protein